MHSSFSKRERLSHKTDITCVFKQGRRYYHDGITLFVGINSLPYNRFLCTFRRGYGTAVKRNRMRRITKEAYRLLKIHVYTGFDIIILLSTHDDSFTQMKGRLYSIFEKAQLLNGNCDDKVHKENP